MLRAFRHASKVEGISPDEWREINHRPFRTAISEATPIDWDDTPTINQAVGIAHGHLLHWRQTWRSDGYSLGELLYSLPLAAGQKRRVADRRLGAHRPRVRPRANRRTSTRPCATPRPTSARSSPR